jgi:hypothetical protein
MKPINEHERQFLARVASEYESRGYRVTLLPAASDMPEFLASFEPDLIAIGNNESVVVEVKGRKELANPQPIAAIEAAIRNRPGWRFELIIDGAKNENGHVLGVPAIVALIDEATELQQNDHTVAALLLVWSAIEGILRLLAARESVELESAAPAYVTSRLYMLGLLDREQYRVLDDAVRIRNRAAHGFQSSITREDLTNIALIARQLLSELESQAA